MRDTENDRTPSKLGVAALAFNSNTSDRRDYYGNIRGGSGGDYVRVVAWSLASGLIGFVVGLLFHLSIKT